MKKLYITLCFSLIALFAQATILHVDQNPNRPAGYYADINLAINNAATGDSIFIYPASLSYGNITVTKKLHFFGFGYKEPIAGVSMLSDVYLDTTTSPNSNPSGTTIQGITLNHLYAKKANINNVKVIGSCFNTSYLRITEGCSNWEIVNNYFKSYNSYINLGNATNVLIANNIFRDNDHGIYKSNSATVIITNNLFMDWRYFNNVFNANVSNNIFICVNVANQTYMANNVFTNNLSWRTNIDPYTMPPIGNTGSGNLSNADPQFETANAYGLFDYTKDYHLKSSSPGKNAGTDNKDIGPYGGTNPFVWGGAFTIPKITELVVKNPVVNQGTNINIQLKAKKADI